MTTIGALCFIRSGDRVLLQLRADGPYFEGTFRLSDDLTQLISHSLYVGRCRLSAMEGNPVWL